jgi:hypothetical protein
MRPSLVALLVVVPALAAAQSAQDKATASSLFEEGKRLLGDGKVDAACPKFEAAQRIAPTLGRKLNLADCYQRAGRTASAWGEFREAAAWAARDADDRESFARGRAADLEKSLSRLKVRLSPGAALAGLEVKRDGAALDKALLDTGVPIDPGAHVVEATAPGHSAWSSKVDVGAGASVTVEIPVLGVPTQYKEPVVARPGPAPVLVPAPTPEPEPEDPGHGRKLLAYGVGAAGLVAVGVGVAFGLSAMSKNSDAKNGHCNDKYQCDQMGVDLVHDAQSAAQNATITIGIGAAAVAAGVVLYLTAPGAEPSEPPTSKTSWRLTPAAGPRAISVGVQGAF